MPLAPKSAALDEDTPDVSEVEEEAEPLIVKKGIELGKASRWDGLREVTVVEETFELPGLMDETLRFMTWAWLGRWTVVQRRAAGATDERVHLEIAGFASLSVRYPTVHDPKEYLCEIVA